MSRGAARAQTTVSQSYQQSNASSRASSRLSTQCHLFAQFLSKGAVFAAIGAKGNIAGYIGCQKLCETIQALSALSQ